MTILETPSLGAGAAFRGVTVTPDVVQFRGIPFATVAERYAVAERVDTYSGVVDATEFGPLAPQPLTPRTGVRPEVDRACPGTDELNCLVLNVTRPKEIPAGTALPVMLWIHPGGNMVGSAWDPMNDPRFLVQASVELGLPVVFVNVQYRLSFFGYLMVREDEPNLASRDQQIALEWVHEHIAAFGGDPANVTLLGESAGSLGTHYHTQAPGSVGLFRRAGMMSTVIEARTPLPVAKARALVDEALAACGVATLDEFRALPPAALVAGVVRLARVYGPVDDGRFFGPGPFAERVPSAADVEAVLLGGCRFEAMFYAPRITAPAPAALYATVAGLPAVGPDLVRLYGFTPDGAEANRARAVQLYDDLSYGAPVHNTTRRLRAAAAGPAVYTYCFDEPNPFDAALDAHHGVDVGFFFDVYALPDPAKYAGLVRRYQTGWLRFAHGLPPWAFLPGAPADVAVHGQDVRAMDAADYAARRRVGAFAALNALAPYDAFELTRRF
ncbi:Alpha/Beta hydrolase protein [Dipodascopsis tothii]|uniref:Alpha/Beta hydrolase protein n=1 Tax=Dipodascopsis tothii TaxID=44089 RepID=UPI0034CD0BF2